MDNPYEPGNYYSNSPAVASTSSSSDKLPGFCMGMFITGLVIAALRVFALAFSVIGLIIYLKNPQAMPTFGMGSIIAELVAGVGIAVFGVAANSLLLAKKRMGLYFAAVLILFVLFSYAVAAVQLFNVSQANAQQQVAPMVIGAAISILFRLALLVAYIAALWMFVQWDKNRGSNSYTRSY